MTTTTQTPSIAVSRGLGAAFALPLLLVGPFISVFDQFVVNLAAPSIATSLGLSGFAYQALVGGYALAFGLGLLMAGRLGDLIGRRRAYVLGLCSFAVTTMLCGVASDATMLGVSRLLQGGSAAIMLPQVLALIRTQFTDDRARGRALSWFGVAISSGIVLGQLCGGLIPQADIAGMAWRPIFFVAVPICLVAAALVPSRVTAGSPVAGQRPGFDLVGLALSSAGLAGVLVPLAAFRQIDPWPGGAILLAAGVTLLAMFAGWQHRRESGERSTLVPPAMMTNRGFLAGLTVNVLLYASVLPAFTVISLFLQRALDLSAGSAALAFVPLGLATALGSWIARTIGSRHGALGLLWGCLASLGGLTALFVLFAVGYARPPGHRDRARRLWSGQRRRHASGQRRAHAQPRAAPRGGRGRRDRRDAAGVGGTRPGVGGVAAVPRRQRHSTGFLSAVGAGRLRPRPRPADGPPGVARARHAPMRTTVLGYARTPHFLSITIMCIWHDALYT